MSGRLHAWRIGALVLLVVGAMSGAAGPARAVEPGLAHAVTPASLGLKAEDIRFAASDSAAVDGWWFAGPAHAPVVVIAARGTGTMADMLPAARQFLERGFGVLTFDYRGFGPRSSPAAVDTLRYIVFDSRWVDDMEGALLYARARGGAQVFAWGQDLGSVVAVAAAARGMRRCDAVAVEGLFPSVRAELLRNGTSVMHDLEIRHRRIVKGRDEAVSTVSRLRCPLFVVLSGRDDVTPVEETRRLLARASSLDETWELPEAGHLGAERTPGYFDRVAKWFRSRMDPVPVTPRR